MRQSTQELFEKYQDSLYIIAFNVCKNAEDAKDVVQDTFMQYMLHNKKEQSRRTRGGSTDKAQRVCEPVYTGGTEFENEQHIRAWLIRVAINKAKNMNHTFWRKNKVSLEEYMDTLEFATPESQELFETVMHLPDKYRIVVHLFYYEDYTVREIAKILKLSESNVKVRLSRARVLLKEKLQEEWENDE